MIRVDEIRRARQRGVDQRLGLQRECEIFAGEAAAEQRPRFAVIGLRPHHPVAGGVARPPAGKPVFPLHTEQAA